MRPKTRKLKHMKGKGQLFSKSSKQKTIFQKKMDILDRAISTIKKRYKKYDKRYPVHEIRGNIPKHVWKQVLDIYSSLDFINNTENIIINRTLTDIQVRINFYQELIAPYIYLNENRTFLELPLEEQDTIEINTLILYNHIRQLVRFHPNDDKYIYNLLNILNQITDFNDRNFHLTILEFANRTISGYRYMHNIIHDNRKHFILFLENRAREKDNISKQEDKDQLIKLIKNRKKLQEYESILRNNITFDNITDIDEYLDNNIP